MTAEAIVAMLLETDEVDPKAFLARKGFEGRSNKAGLHLPMYDLPGATRRKGKGHDDQWEILYKDWKFVVSFYADGTQIWSAHYKSPAFSWSSPQEQKQGFSWSGGGEVEKLPADTDPRAYLARLQKMADAHPNVWKNRHIPHMPHPNGPDHYGANY